MKRITTIAIFDDITNEKIAFYLKEGFCKVPKMVDNRIEMDILPLHITLSELCQVKNASVLSVRVQESTKGGFGLYLDTNIGHITLAIFDNQEDAKKEYAECLTKFKPFIAHIKAVQSYEIYPAKLLYEVLIY